MNKPLYILGAIIFVLFLYSAYTSRAVNDPAGGGIVFSNFFTMSTDFNSTSTLTCLTAGVSGGNTNNCFGSGFSRNITILRAGQFPGTVSSFACLVDSVTGAGAGDAISFYVVEGTPGTSNTITATSTSLTFTFGGSPGFANNTLASSTSLSRLVGYPGLNVRALLTDNDGSVTSLSASCYVTGTLRYGL